MKKLLLSVLSLMSILSISAQDIKTYVYVAPTYSLVGNISSHNTTNYVGFITGFLTGSINEVHGQAIGCGVNAEVSSNIYRISPYVNLQHNIIETNLNSSILFADCKIGYSMGFYSKSTNTNLHGLYTTAGLGLRKPQKGWYATLSYRLDDYRKIKYQNHGAIIAIGYNF